MNKKIIVLFVVLFVVVFSGCGDDKEKKEEVSSAQSDNAAVQDAKAVLSKFQAAVRAGKIGEAKTYLSKSKLEELENMAS